MRQHPTKPTLDTLLNQRINIAMATMNCISVGTIQSFDGATQTASVSINYKRVIKDAIPASNGIDTVDKIVEYPLLVQCPVVFLRGGVSSLTLPVTKGDQCILMFCDRDIESWFSKGTTDAIPGSERLHDLTDAIALCGISSLANPMAAFNTIIASLMDKTGERLSQAGDMKATARTTAPSGWLLCYGQAVSRTTYDVLFTAIGTTYGAGDGSLTFNVPDYRGRTFVGLDNMGGSSANVLTNTYTPNRNTLGGAVGEEAHQLTIPEMPAHTHTLDTYSYDQVQIASRVTCWNVNQPQGETTTDPRGNDVPHNTVQPGRMCNIIIKT